MKDATKVLGILAVAILLPALYVGAYLAMLKNDTLYFPPHLHFDLETGIQWPQDDPFWYPAYRFGGDLTAAVFWPAYRIDRQLRPNKWACDDCPDDDPLPPT